MSDKSKKNTRTPLEHELYLPSGRILGQGPEQEMRRLRNRMGRRAFMGFGAAALAGFGGWRWLVTRQTEDDLPWPFRRALETNERLARDYFSHGHLARTYDTSAANPKLRVNGSLGMSGEFNPAVWSLNVFGVSDSVMPDSAETDSSGTVPGRDSSAAPPPDSGAPGSVDSVDVDEDDQEVPPTEAENNSLHLKMDDIRKLPYVEQVTELRCIEGWNEIVHWGGARLADFVAAYPPMTRSGDEPDVRRKPDDLLPYISMETPDGKYYVGLEIESALHPQTLLCYSMNGKPLTPEHGAPLRLVVPVKYGVKNIKRIGTIRYTSRRPADYWAEQGYDWFAGL